MEPAANPPRNRLTSFALPRLASGTSDGNTTRVPVVWFALALLALLIAGSAALTSREVTPASRLIAASSPQTITHERTVGPVERPAGLAVTTDGRIFVVDSARGRANVFGADGTLLTTIGLPTFEAKDRRGGQLTSPLGVAVDELGDRVYISDLATRQISIFTSSGEFRGYLGTDALAGGTPGALFYRDGRLYVCDLERHNVLALSTEDGSTAARFGASGTVAMDHPNGVWVSATGEVTVADSNQNRIHRFAANGRLLQTTDVPLYHPRGLAEDESGRLWVAATLDHKVVVLTPNGQIEAELTAAGTQELGFPTALAINDGRVFVTDRAGHAVQVWQLEG